MIHPELNETSVDTVKYYLHDDGLDDDLNAEDGVYTTTVSPPSDGVSYIIKVVGIGEGASAYVSRQHYVGWGPKENLDFRSNHHTAKMKRSADFSDAEVISAEQVKIGAGQEANMNTRISGGKYHEYQEFYYDSKEPGLMGSWSDLSWTVQNHDKISDSHSKWLFSR